MYYHTKIYLLDNLRGLLPFPMVPMGLFSPRCPILMKLTADHYSRAVDNLGEWMDFKEDEGISLLINMPDVFSSQAGHFFSPKTAETRFEQQRTITQFQKFLNNRVLFLCCTN